MSLKSLDPRITREGLPETHDASPLGEIHHWGTYEVFHQTKKGDRHIHVGSVHAPNPEMAYILAKEQFARRAPCVSLWVVKTTDVYQTNYRDEDMYENNPEKMYREAGGYKVMERINKYKKDHPQNK
ncbi:MAG: hypothetical protein K1X85_08375 [Ignavibacteria bacterium]|nr:hypothetical protein [Ignavibacteria bacterium]